MLFNCSHSAPIWNHFCDARHAVPLLYDWPPLQNFFASPTSNNVLLKLCIKAYVTLVYLASSEC